MKTAEAKERALQIAKEHKETRVYNYPVGSVIVPLEESRAHNYPIGKPFLVLYKDEDGQAYGGLMLRRVERCDGPSYFGNFHFGEWRYATEEEIDLFFTKVNKKVLAQS